ncbi:MBOAT family O-acyltransferase [Pseudoduganella namucuonensis]|uniref:Probable alginate O-acetylase AlgI n=1 Tax=Pseudoduganella namucuonensis TaxID=1035707 RepID=A0A1I7JU40_9BURK|nr:MBOAT family protein [Pseudoduganella namucuonensis]SFU88675.1 alginate O-acetyltransferase complex protein AlgI [Pseudoduganella namucuonensis]
MVFSSVTFLFYFLPAFLLLYYALPWKNAILLVASLLFYAWGEPRFVPLLLASALLNYGFGLAIARAGARRKLALGLGVAANLGMLGYYKYAGFFADIAGALLQSRFELPAIVLPLGISFFVFQGISYLVDVYRGQVDPQKSFWNFAMYKAMFPQLIAGPIVRYRQIAGEIEHREVPAGRLWRGFKQFVLGLAQKVLVANTVAQAADALFTAGPAHLSTAGAWLAVACYSIQILYDFAGYSNMAIGIGHMIGFSYPPNFDRPYSARSITEFWRRWHISLSSWFRDYVYIPLGGNRLAPWRTYANLAIVFLLCGLWHGAAWTFVLWGAWHGALLVAERGFLGAWLARMPRAAAQAYTLLMVMLGWVFFRASDVPTALRLLQVMFSPGDGGPLAHPWRIDVGPVQWTALAVGAALAVLPAPWSAPAAAPARPGWRVALQVPLALATFVLCSASLASGTYNPFIYFRF